MAANGIRACARPSKAARIRAHGQQATPADLAEHRTQHEPLEPVKFACVARFELHTLERGPCDLQSQLPVRATIIARLAGPGGESCWCAHLDAPLKYHLPPDFDYGRAAPTALTEDEHGPLIWVHQVVVAPGDEHASLHAGMINFAVHIGYVIDPSLSSEHLLDMRKIDYVGYGDIDDVPDLDTSSFPLPSRAHASEQSPSQPSSPGRVPDPTPNAKTSEVPSMQSSVQADEGTAPSHMLAEPAHEFDFQPDSLPASEESSFPAETDVGANPSPAPSNAAVDALATETDASQEPPGVPEIASTISPSPTSEVATWDAIISDTEFSQLLDDWVAKLTAVAGEKPRYIPEPDGVHSTGIFYHIAPDKLSYQAVRDSERLWTRTTTDPDELVYWIISDTASAIARSRNRESAAGRYRPPWVVDWHALMHALSPAWGLRTQARIDAMTREEWQRRH